MSHTRAQAATPEVTVSRVKISSEYGLLVARGPQRGDVPHTNVYRVRVKSELRPTSDVDRDRHMTFVSLSLARTSR